MCTCVHVHECVWGESVAIFLGETGRAAINQGEKGVGVGRTLQMQEQGGQL